MTKTTRSKLTVLSYGGGQDSTAILYRMLFDQDIRQTYAPGYFLVVMSATGNEYPVTDTYVQTVAQLCKDHGVEFAHVTPDLGYHNKSWESLTAHYDRNHVLMMVGGNRSCTDQLKISPFYKFLNRWVAQKYNLPEGAPNAGKQALVRFAARKGKIRVLIGFSAGEESRVTPDSSLPFQWQRRSIRRVFPLIEWGWDRLACQRYIHSLGQVVPWPSHCMFCPFTDLIGILYLARKHPEVFAQWVQHERHKLRKFAHLGERNHGVFGNRTLPEKLAEAERKYGHLPMAEIERHRFSHGHCVRSKY